MTGPPPRTVSRAVTLMAFTILFVGGFDMGIPRHGWAEPIQLFHGVYVDDTLLGLYLFVVVTAGVSGQLLKSREAWTFAGLFALLASLGVVSAGVNPYLLTDVGEALRLLLHAAYLLAAVHWSRSRGATFVLRSFLMGLTTGGAISLYFAFVDPPLTVGILPMLHAQNGVGPSMAVAMLLGAWLMMIGRTWLDTLVAIASALIGLAGVAMSFSQIAMLIGLCGIAAWLIILTQVVAARRWSFPGAVGGGLLIVAAVYVVPSGPSLRGAPRSLVEESAYAASIVRAVQLKFGKWDIGDKHSVGSRYQYFWGVLEIVTQHPLAGVSYGGFYDAITRTEPYQAGLMADESLEAGRLGSSNPHNAFLYYAAANGLPGLVVSCLIYFMFLRHLRQSLGKRGWRENSLWVLFALGYFVHAMTLPSLFNTKVLLVPAAVAIATVVERRMSRARRWVGPVPGRMTAITALPS